MSKLRTLSLIAAAATLGLSSPALAQGRSAVSGAELDAAVAARPANHRQVVREFLSTSEAQSVAGAMGVTTSDLESRLAIMDDAALARLAGQIEAGDLAGGANTVVISTTAIIIGLLILILLVD